MLFEKNHPFKLLFVGDSITDCGRDRGLHGADLGSGFVNQVDFHLRSQLTQIKCKVVNVGISGNRIIDLESRWQKDVLAHKPDYVVLCIGINDVWRQFDSPHLKQVTLEAYSEKLSSLIRQTQPLIKEMCILSPFLLESNLDDPMRSMMDQYRAAARTISKVQSTSFVDLQRVFDAWIDANVNSRLSDDRVHPNSKGHEIITRAFLCSVGIDLD